MQLVLSIIYSFAQSSMQLSFIGSCHVGVSKRFSRKPCSLLSLYFFLFFWEGGGLIRSLADPTLAALIVCGPLQLVTHQCYARGGGWDHGIGWGLNMYLHLTTVFH